MIRRTLVALILISVGFSARLSADVKLPAIFANNMVLQRDMPIPVWGTADPAERVTVKLGDQVAAATADAAGRWMVKLAAMKAGDPLTLKVSGKNEIQITQVLVGEVWLASGQSNMEMSVGSSLNATDEISVDYPAIRMFTVVKAISDTPQSDVKGEWAAAVSGRARRFSAAGYFFARYLHQSLKVPVGIIHSSWGGTAAEGWTPPSAFASNPALKIMADRYQKALETYPADLEKYKFKKASWDLMVKEAQAANQQPPKAPPQPSDPSKDPSHPSALYNGMIAPLVPYGMRGVIWYQGETNAGRADEYTILFAAMIQDWRRIWAQGDFPFLFVQLANYMDRQEQPSDTGWARLRESQFKTLSLPNTGMALAIDIGDGRDIHPKNKQDVGRRLALWALAKTYGQDIVCSGPLYESMAVEADHIRIRFTSTGGALVAGAAVPATVTTRPADAAASAGDSAANALRGPQVLAGVKLEGFAIAGEDRQFVWADARIEGDTVIVSSARVPKPVAVRYAWADNPACNLYNKQGLPASPFRSDIWPARGGAR